MSVATGMSPAWNAARTKLTDYLSVYDEPIPSLRDVNTIPDAPICGSGKLTVAVDGNHRDVSYHFSKSDFWHITSRWETLFQKYHIRQAPLCRLALTVHNAAGDAAGFRHVQDMSGAEIRSALPVAGGVLNVRCVPLAQRDLVLYELEATDAPVSVTVALETDNECDNFFILEGHQGAETVWVRKEHTSFITVNAAVVMRVMGGDNVRPTYDGGFKAALSVEVRPGSTVRLLLSAKGGKDEYEHLEQSLAAVAAVGADDIAALLGDHAEWWRDFWLKSWLDIGDPAIERFYYGAQYVHGCSVDLDGRVVPGLAGGWITNPNPIWGGTYTMNYNGESPFWGLCSSNRGEFVLPYARACQDFVPQGRELAGRLGTRGFVMPVMIGPWGITDNDDALGQKSNASMSALAMIWHYQTTRDREFLAHTLYPYLRELMEYWEDNLELDDSGRYVIHGSARERNPGDVNPGEDLAFVRQILETVQEGSEILGLDADRRDLWRDYQDRLSDYPVANVEGNLCFKEAENRMCVSLQGVGDNVCALNPVYPGGAIDRDPSGKGRIIARNTLRYLQSWNQANSFTRVFCQAVRAEWPGGELLDLFKARITGEGDGPFEHLRRNNTFLPHIHSFEGTAPTEFINSMLAQAHGGVLKVFGVWPKDRNASFSRLRVCGAFLVSGKLQDGVVTDVEILSEQGETCRMLSCWPGHAMKVEQVTAGATAPVAVREDEGAYAWDTVPGGVYRVTIGEAVQEESSNSPLMLVPIFESAAKAEVKHTDAALDIVLTPRTRSTQLALDVVYADESRSDCTAACQFAVRDAAIAQVRPDGVLSGIGRGRTCVDVTAEIDGAELAASISVYVLPIDVVMDVTVTTAPSDAPPRDGVWNTLKSLEVGYGMDGPDVISRARSNSYGFGTYRHNGDGKDAWLQFDFGSVSALDEMWVWNYNCPADYRVLWWNGGRANGLRDVRIEYSEAGENWVELETAGHPFRLAQATGKQWMPAGNLDDGRNSPIRFEGARARYVKVIPDPEVGVGNWGGPGFGVSQVRFTRFPQ